MARSILDQNGIILLNGQENYDAIIISPMFMWELFNNINSPIEKTLIQRLRLISDRIVITFKSTSCEETEIDSGAISSFDSIIDHQKTQFIRHWLHDINPSISYIRDTMANGLTSEFFMRLFNEYAQATWLPKLQEEFNRLGRAKNRQLTRNSFEAKNEVMTEDLCHKSISACYQILKSKGFTHEQAILFLKEPSVLYNRVFCYSAIYIYRSTQAAKNSLQREMVANDNKDAEYLFLAHHAEDLISDDKFMKLIFSHLKKSYRILSNMKTDL